MNRVLTLAGVLSLALAVSLAAQAGQKPTTTTTTTTTMPTMKTTIVSETDYSTVMKEVGPTAQALNKAIMSADEAAAAKAAARLTELFNNVHAYWVGKKVDDASNFARDAVMALQAVSKAIAAHDMTAAGEARQKLQAQCMGCHTAHREKTPEGGWKMK
jgi:NH3-dependent NAD+ synthetase